MAKRAEFLQVNAMLLRYMNGDSKAQIDALLSAVKRDIDISTQRRIYCNRNLKMEGIELIGWDMDYTLALYHQERLEKLSIDLTLKKMIANRGYPEEILGLTFNPDLAIRGIVLDCPNGNVFKMDRHGYIGRVFHGTHELSGEIREKKYRSNKIRLSSDRYRWIDTLFGLPDAVMYMTMVDWVDGREKNPDYLKLFWDIRNSIDEAHRDDTLKTVIKEDMPNFVHKDPGLADMLHKFRSSGKKQFLLTNSYWLYTNEVMKYLLDGERKAYGNWQNYFDFVIVGGSKPGFFNERKPFLEVDVETGIASEKVAKELRGDKVYQGGNIHDFEEMTKVRGDGVLYVGDHIYGDMIRLKKSRGWRTAMVLQELDDENSTSDRFASKIKDLRAIDRRRRNLQSEIDYQVLLLKQIQRLLESCEDKDLRPRLASAKDEARQDLDSLRNRSKMMLEEVGSLEQSIDRSYNLRWGAMFREGNETSRFGQQVAEYADLYTSRASNFLSYSPLRYFRAPRKVMPHEL